MSSIKLLFLPTLFLSLNLYAEWENAIEFEASKYTVPLYQIMDLVEFKDNTLRTTLEEKEAIVAYIPIGFSKKDFFKNRRVRGPFSTKLEHELNPSLYYQFISDFPFLDRKEARKNIFGLPFEVKGKYDLSHALIKDHLEYLDNNFEKTPGVEIHFRQGGDPVLFIDDVIKFIISKGLPQDRTNMHMHIPGVKPKFKNNISVLQFAEFYRRVNLLLAASWIFSYPKATMSTTALNYSILTSERLASIIEYLSEVKKGQTPEYSSNMQLADIGFVGLGKYDRPDLIGMEVRAIIASLPNSEISTLSPSIPFDELCKYSQHSIEITRTIEQFMRAEKFEETPYVLSEAVLKRWANKHKLIRKGRLLFPQIANALWFTQSFRALLDAQPKVNRAPFELLSEELAEHTPIKLLAYPWQNDPLITSQPDFDYETYHLSKAKHITELDSAESLEDATSIVRDFLHETGIYRIIKKSLGF